MALIRNRKPNVEALLRREDIDGLIEAARYRQLLRSRSGQTLDLGEPVREEAILALGALGPQAGNGHVARALEDPSDRVRIAAVRVLLARAESRPLADAVGRLPADGHARKLALNALLELRQVHSARLLAASLVRAPGDEPVDDDDASLLSKLVEADEGSDATAGVVEDLIAALSDERDAVAERAEELLAVLAPASTQGVIAELLGGASPHRAASVLGRIRDNRAMEPLVEGLEHRDPRVRAECAAALGQLRDPAAVEPLMRATRDADARVRSHAGWALDHIGAVAVMVGVSYLLRPMIFEAMSAERVTAPSANGRSALPEGPPVDPAVARRLAAYLEAAGAPPEADDSQAG